jgi:hypothetical protein
MTMKKKRTAKTRRINARLPLYLVRVRVRVRVRARARGG